MTLAAWKPKTTIFTVFFAFFCPGLTVFTQFAECCKMSFLYIKHCIYDVFTSRPLTQEFKNGSKTDTLVLLWQAMMTHNRLAGCGWLCELRKHCQWKMDTSKPLQIIHSNRTSPRTHSPAWGRRIFSLTKTKKGTILLKLSGSSSVWIINKFRIRCSHTYSQIKGKRDRFH